MSSFTLLRAGLLWFAAIGCGGKPPASSGPPSSSGAAAAPAGSITGREWVLVALDDRPSPAGAQGKPATIQFNGASSCAAGFAGCNRFSEPYTPSGDSLAFDPLVSTKMACADGDALERSFLAALPKVTGYTAADSTLTENR